MILVHKVSKVLNKSKPVVNKRFKLVISIIYRDEYSVT